jgi:hypothetical protein
MAASRATSLRALTKLAASSTPRNARSLHMTGPSSVSPILTTTKPSRAKVQTAIDDAKTSQTSAEANTSTTTRHFNTSRSLKSVHDSSTIDFAYLPDFDPDSGVAPPTVRVPLLPPSLYPASTKTSYTKEEEEIVMRPEINLISADSTHIATPAAFTEVTDNMMFEGVSGVFQETTKKVGEEVGELKKIWGGLLDDVLGAKSKHA